MSTERTQEYLDKRYGQTKALVKEEHPELGVIGLIIELLECLSNESELISFLHKYKIIPEEVMNFQSLGRYAEGEFIREMSKFFKKEEVADLLGSIDDISDVYNSILKESLINANKQVTDRLFDHEDYQERIEIFENLYEIGVLSGGYFKSYIECTNCLPKTFSGYFTCDITPSKLHFLCPNCGQEVYYMVPYQIHRGLYDHIVDKDGILVNAISYLLDQHKVKYEKNKNLEDENEIDFVIMKGEIVTTLIEAKMFRTDKSDDALISNLLEAVTQVKKTKDKLVKVNERYRSLEYIVISNITDRSIYNVAKNKCSNDIDDYKIHLMSPDDFANSI